ncbi:nuclear transport factor 2 family protein [Pseudonocardia spinosispora]|uniref:nuclear transport factor 2 family protein n=1 Tax=Pseudonocardia spinosispora TaxID=103441 RepID=UPI0003F87CFF|nr:nuclear transport factor 2 family protein [Pseudonocardia spinosispora]
MTDTVTGWTPELFAQFWAAPDPAPLPGFVTEDVVGHWPGNRKMRGADDYIKALVDLMALLPDIHLEVHAGAMNGEFGFVRWVMHATGSNGPFQLDGADCITVRDGQVRENYINFDTAEFRRLSGHDLPF